MAKALEVMTHGDDNGLRVPPRLARIRAVVAAIKDDEAVPAKVRPGRRQSPG